MPGSGLMSSQSPKQERFVYPSKGGVAGEVGDLRKDIENELAALAALALEDFGAAALDIADVNGIKEVFQSLNATAVTYSGAELDGVVGAGAMSPPRNVTVTTGAGGTPGESPSEATITGVDVAGLALVEVLALSQSAGEDTGVKLFARVDEVALKDDGTGTGAALEVGFGDLVGLSKAAVALASLAAPALIHEVVDTAVATNGALSLPATNAPYGAYIPNGGVAAVKYAIIYPYNPSA